MEGDTTIPQDTCPGCLKRYALAERFNAPVPLLLTCHHHLCENCVKDSLSNNDQIFVVCKRCNEKSVPKQPPSLKNSPRDSPREYFRVAQGLIDMLHSMRNPKAISEQEIGFAEVLESEPVKCDECGKEIAQGKCDVCQSLYCDACFTKVHAGSKTLQRHKKISLNETNDSVSKDIVAPLSGSKLSNEFQSKSFWDDVLKKCEEKRNVIAQSLVNADDLHRKMREDLQPLQVIRRETGSYIANLQKKLTHMLTNLEERAESIEKSTEKSLVECEDSLKQLDKHIEEVQKTIVESINIAHCDDQRMMNLNETFERLMKAPDSIKIEKPCQIKELNQFPKDCLNPLRRSLNNSDLGTGGEYSLVEGRDGVSEDLVNQVVDDRPSSVEVPSADLCRGRSEIPGSVPRKLWPGQVSNYRGDADVAKPGPTFSSKSNQMNSRKKKSAPEGPVYVPTIDNTRNALHSSRKPYDSDINAVKCPAHIPIIDNNYDTYPSKESYDNGMHASAPVKTSSSTTNRGVAPGANMQKVFISHVESPSDFWIQYPGDRRELESYDNEIGSRNGASLTVAALNKCSINNTLLFTLQENCLRRVKVMSLDTSSSVKVHFVDYGYKRCVELSSLRTIENHRILNRMPLCQNCRLYDCYPYGEPDWNEKIIERFKELVEKQELNMHVFAVRESKLEVDLSAKSFSSARDYLVSLDQAQYLPPDRKIYGIKKSSEILHYQTNMHRYEPNTRISADVMHLDSPGEFYLSEVDETWDRELDQLNSELDSYFRLSYHYKNAYLHNLAIGMAIAAQYCDNKWYRAEVCEVSDSSPRHKVKYVDFGTYETLNLTRMRAIPEQYVHLPVRAVRSSLHDIVPLKKTWQPDALQSFVALVNNVRLDVLIHNITGDELKVSLFKKNHKSIKEEKNPLLCINEVLVQEGKARGIGIYNKVLPVAKKEAPVAKKEAPVAKKEAPGAKKEAPVAKKEAPVAKKEAPVAKKEAPVAKKEVPVEKKEAPVAKKEEPVDAASGSVTDEEKDLSPQKKPEAVENMERSSSIEKPELEGDVMQSSSLLQSDLSATDVNVNDKKDSLKVPIEIVRCSDPHLIHVRTDQQRVSLADLLGRMKEHYNAKKMSADTSRLKISNEMRCAVLIREDDRWYRAKVLKKLSDYTFHVYLNDCGRNEEVSLPNIRPLEDEFTNVPDGCTRCSLYGFSNEHTWPSKLCEKLKELTQTFEHYYMTVKGRQGKTVEILLWAKVIQCDGPLDPTRTEWINIGSKLQTSEDQEDISLVPPLESNLKQVDSDCSSKDTDRKVKKWLNEMTVAKKKDLSENGSDPKFASSHDTVDDGDSVSTELEDSDVEDSASATEDHNVERSQWMPPVPLKKKKFIGIPKFVTETMEIRVQLLKDQKAVEKLQAKLQEHYGMKDVYDPSDTWTYGRICVSRFRFDDNWYRAQVINISQNEREVFVEYVDYGSVDWMSMSKVRSDVICTRKPLLCHKLSVLPAYEKVSEDVVVYIQKLFADKHCTIELSEVGPDNVCRIKSLSYTDAETDEFISLYEELDRLMIGPLSPLSDELETKIVSSDDSTSETDTSISSIQDMSEAPFYNPDQIRLKYLENFSISCAKQETDDETLQILEVQPPTSEIVTVKVTEILRENLIAVHIIDCQSNPKIAKVAKKFIKLETHLNKDGIKQPIIKPPFVGRVCCTQFEDNMWYRAFVVEKDDCADRYAVYYMDYGNTTYVVASKLHQLKPEWYKVPAQAVKCNTILSGAPLPELSEFILNHNYRAIIHKTDFKKKRNEPNELKYSIQLLDCEYCKFSA